MSRSTPIKIQILTFGDIGTNCGLPSLCLNFLDGWISYDKYFIGMPPTIIMSVLEYLCVRLTISDGNYLIWLGIIQVLTGRYWLLSYCPAHGMLQIIQRLYFVQSKEMWKIYFFLYSNFVNAKKRLISSMVSEEI